MASTRKTIFLNNYFYHVFNRGIERRTIFLNKHEYDRFREAFVFYRLEQSASLRYSRVQLLNKEDRINFELKMAHAPQRVSILAYCLMPNHFHFLLRQEQEGGISSFVSDLSNSYTKYFNTKHNRVGPLFQGPFHAVHVETEEQLIHLSRYIHINPFVSSVFPLDAMIGYPYSSLRHYLQFERQAWLNTKIILSYFPKEKEYEQFTLDQISYGRELEKIKHLTLEE